MDKIIEERKKLLLEELAKTLRERQIKRELQYKQEFDKDNFKKLLRTSMAGLGSWLRKEG